MKTIRQVAELTGVSTRTLQYYDEIGLLKPSKLTDCGYRLYDDEALQRLQQILFLKELDFKLKEIKEILLKPDYDKITAYQKQKELLCLKRARIDRLVGLLGRLEKGETCMSFKEFDLSEYIEALEKFKNTKSEEVLRHWGSLENFEQFIQKIKKDESNIARLAVKQFGSVEKYTEAMKYNLEHFSEIMKQADEIAEKKEDIASKNDALFRKLTSDLTKAPASQDIQALVREIVAFTLAASPVPDLGEGYWDILIESYSHDAVREITDKKYGPGASAYIAEAFRHYLHRQPPLE